MYKVVVVVALLLLVVRSSMAGPYSSPAHDIPAKYYFQYDVKDDYSGNDYTHSEDRDDYNTKGQYQILLPDGRVQTVDYTVTKEGGFQANVAAQGVKSYA
ncbi:cuticle protein 19-like [Panulirus ornatus]|uniref:cuticle protein 19-like n=1 Tax=Panulirus ornatus TaxID=150431 RepID=UPI003A870846